MLVCEGWLAECTYIAGVAVDDGLALNGTVLAVSSVAGHCNRYGGWGLWWVVEGVVMMVVFLSCNDVRSMGNRHSYIHRDRGAVCKVHGGGMTSQAS